MRKMFFLDASFRGFTPTQPSPLKGEGFRKVVQA